MCNHHETKQIGRDYCFFGSVAVTDENPAAHGCISYDEECCACGARRSVNQNGRHFEHGPWGPSRVEREALEREAQQAQAKHKESEARAFAQALGVKVLHVSNDRVLIERTGQAPQWIWMGDIHAAARQPDTGDGLVPFYRGVELLVNEFSMHHLHVRAY